MEYMKIKDIFGLEITVFKKHIVTLTESENEGIVEIYLTNNRVIFTKESVSGFLDRMKCD